MLRANSRDGTSIAYDRTGTGPALVVFDGAFCSRNFGLMPKLAPLLVPYFTVYAYDRRGRGDSGDTLPYTVEREIEDLDLMIHIAGGTAAVFSISSGAMLALRAAASGLAIRKLAVYEPPYMVGNPKHLPPPDHHTQLSRMIAENRRSDAVKYFMTRVIGLPAVLPFFVQLLPIWSSMKANAPSLPHDSAVAGDFRLPRELLASITTPTLVVSGSRSQTVLREAAQAVAGTVPGARQHVLEKQTHNVSPKALAPVLIDHLSA